MNSVHGYGDNVRRRDGRSAAKFHTVIWNAVQRLDVGGLICAISLRYSPDPTA